MSNNAHDLSKRLLNALDNSYNVVDMHAVNEIISILERFNITKELLETTRLGKHVNELRRKTSDPTLARRAKVLVKKWRDLVIPTTSPGHTGMPGSNRSSAERSVRRLGGTPLTSPALTRQVLSPAMPTSRPPSRPAWGGYESDSQDVILVDDEPDPPPNPLRSLSPAKRSLSPATESDDKKAKRDKKPKKRRPHLPTEGWPGRNGRHNGAVDAYTKLVSRVPAAGKKVKTTKELLEEIQSRGGPKPVTSRSPSPPSSPDVMLIEPDPIEPVVLSPPLNGVLPPRSPSPPPCLCGADPDPACPHLPPPPPAPPALRALHCSLLHGVNGIAAPRTTPIVAPRPPSVVPKYNYLDYADDYCVKNMNNVPLCTHLTWDRFVSPQPSPPPLSPPPIRPYPIDSPPPPEQPPVSPPQLEELPPSRLEPTPGPEPIGIPKLEPADVVKKPILSIEDEELINVRSEKEDTKVNSDSDSVKMEVCEQFASEPPEHRTVERTKEYIDGRTLYSLCESARSCIPYSYEQTFEAPVLSLPLDDEGAETLEKALEEVQQTTRRDEMGRPVRPDSFAEWHESAMLGDLIALPYVVID